MEMDCDAVEVWSEFYKTPFMRGPHIAGVETWKALFSLHVYTYLLTKLYSIELLSDNSTFGNWQTGKLAVSETIISYMLNPE